MNDIQQPQPQSPMQPIQGPVPLREKKRGSRRAAAVIVTSIVVLASVIAFLYLRSAPAKGIITQGTPTTSQLAPTVEDRLVPYTQNPYMKYSYISSYHLSTTKLEESGQITRAEFLATRPAYKQMEVYVIKESSIAEDSSVHYRRLYPQLYKEERLDSAGLKGAIFTRSDQGFERIAFFSNGSYVGVLSLTSNSSDVYSGMHDFNRVLGIISWR